MPAYPRKDPVAVTRHVKNKDFTPPSITRITLPHSTDTSPDSSEDSKQLVDNMRSLSTSRSPSDSFVEDDIAPPVDDEALNELWGTLRMKKEKRMAKERSKVKSLEAPRSTESGTQEASRALEIPGILEGERLSPGPTQTVDNPGRVVESSLSKSEEKPLPRSLPRQKSVTSFRESPDGRTMVASIDMRGVPKENVHVSFQRTRLVVTWVVIEVTDWEEEEGVWVREKCEKNYQRTFPLPEGTRFDEITGAMSGRHLLLRYPNSRSFRVENRSDSGGL